MGGHQVRLGAVTALACRGCRIVKSCDSFGLGLARCGPGAHIGCKQRALSQPPPLPPIRDLLSLCLAAAAPAGCGAANRPGNHGHRAPRTDASPLWPIAGSHRTTSRHQPLPSPPGAGLILSLPYRTPSHVPTDRLQGHLYRLGPYRPPSPLC
jgi:hypothetical protein